MEQAIATPDRQSDNVDDWVPVEKPTVHMEFKGLSFSVTKNGHDVHILRDVSGCCSSGRLLAIMGASGAGKTTLLDILAGNLYSGHTSGKVLVNGQPRRAKGSAPTSCYVMQRDTLLSSATVREAVLTSALLRLPRTMPRADKEAHADRVLRELDLVGCADTLIGDESIGIKGISGGQKRRVSVATELVKDPELIFLDEPTSGLDSETAVMLMATLVQLARKGRTVVATIHQPNSDITDCFDDFMLLAKGRMVYSGPWNRAVDWFGEHGYSCPLYTNPTDYFMKVVKDDDALTKLLTAYDKAQEEDRAAAAGNGPTRTDLEAQSRQDASPSSAKPPTTTLYQTAVLSQRFFRSWWRNPQMLAAEVVQYLFMALLTGLMYLNVTDEAAAGSYDRSSAIWFSLAVLSFTPSYTAVVVWDKERLLMKRELGGQQYSVAAFFAARTLTTVPFQVAQTVMYVSISYWMIGLQADAAKFFIFLSILVMFMLTSETIGLLVAIACRTATNSVVVLTLVLLLLLSFSGFLTSQIKPWFVWIQKASYLTYALNGALRNEMEGLTLYEDGQPVDGADYLPIDNGLSVSANVAVLAGQMVGWRAITWAALEVAAKVKWL